MNLVFLRCLRTTYSTYPQQLDSAACRVHTHTEFTEPKKEDRGFTAELENTAVAVQLCSSTNVPCAIGSDHLLLSVVVEVARVHHTTECAILFPH